MIQSSTMASRLAGSFGTAFAGGKLKFYSGALPPTPDTPIIDVLIATLNLPSPCFTNPVNGEIDLFGNWEGAASANGTIGWCKLESTITNLFAMASVGLPGSGKDVIISSGSDSVVIGDIIQVATMHFTIPQIP